MISAVIAFDPPSWHDYFLATSGAGAALAGLVFVALSINLREILKGPFLVSRAGEAVTLLVEIVIVGLFGLTPGIDSAVLGVLIAATGLIVWGVVTRARIRAFGAPGPTLWQRIWAFGVTELATIPVVIAGASLIAGTGGGLYWLIVGVAFGIAASMVDAWVLLVEILR